MGLTEDEALLFLAHLGDGTIGSEVDSETIEKVNSVQRKVGIHGDCHDRFSPTIEELKEILRNG